MAKRLIAEEMYPAGVRDVRVRYVRTRSGLRVRLIESGDPAGTPVLLIHGWACTVHVFRRNIPALAAAGLRVLAMDLKGHGLTDRPTSREEYTLDAMTSFVLEVMDALELRRATLVGQSLGGAIALQIALRAPERVERLALIAPVGLGRVPRARLLRALATLSLSLGAPRELRRWMIAVALDRAFGDLARPTSDDVAEYWAPSADPHYLKVLLTLVHEVDWAPLDASRLSVLRLPLLVIWGTEDRLVVPTHVRDLPRLIPSARAVWIAGAGHACNEEAPAETNGALVAFLAEGRGARGEDNSGKG
ncbi:MAG TPA: alpha/beta fold hydrolase [Gemmatimonadaceae bacterium]|nr:alpha/beta fold hydrolase [Gemmatimonadaceae bacterium]